VKQPFDDRRQAGRLLGEQLQRLRVEHPVVVGLPRGGVPVAYEVARALGAPLDVIIVRKLGVPTQPELAMGAIGEDGVRVTNHDVVRMARVTEAEIAAVEARERIELERRVALYRPRHGRVALSGRTVVVVDDGIATGATARAALAVARAHGAARVVLAVPVAADQTLWSFEEAADEIVALVRPTDLVAVGRWYRDFDQTSDEEVAALLEAANAMVTSGAIADPGERPTIDTGEHVVTIPAGAARLPGLLTVPAGATGVVVFAHGSGSSRLSPRNRLVADTLQRHGLATLLFDLLTDREARDRANVFDIPLLAERLVAATAWLRTQPLLASLPVGFFGASTGAAAALWAASALPDDVAAVVSRGGRPDLAGERLAAVRAPTLLIVGSLDHEVLALNQQAARQLGCAHRLEVVAGATHLFEEPGTLEMASTLASDWFLDCLRPAVA